MSNCRDCGREEWGFLSALDDDGYCYSCAAKHNKEKIARLQEQLDEAVKIVQMYQSEESNKESLAFLRKWGYKNDVDN